MSLCMGDIPVSAKVDREMQEFLEAEARDRGLTRAELVRRLLDTYRESRREQLGCPHCDKAVVIDVSA